MAGLTSSVAKDLKPYTTLSYANGPGHEGTFKMDGTRQDLTYVDTSKQRLIRETSYEP